MDKVASTLELRQSGRSAVSGGSDQTMAVCARLSINVAMKAWRQAGLSKSERGCKVVWYQKYCHACFCRTDHVLLNGRNPLLSVICVTPEAKGKLSIPD